MININLEEYSKQLSELKNKERKILLYSCPCCRGRGVVFVTRKKHTLEIECSCSGEKEIMKDFYKE